jgi:tetratricopeptide (TPR) repeat protein
LKLQLNLAQQGFVIPRSTENLEAYDYLLRGLEHLTSSTKDGNTKARQMFEKAIELDPKYAMAYAFLGDYYYLAWANAHTLDLYSLDRAQHTEQKAIALDGSLSIAHSILAAAYVQEGEDAQAVNEAERGIALDSNSAFGYLWLAEVLNNQYKSGEALAAVNKAMRLDPRNPENHFYLWEQGLAYAQLAQREKAVSVLKRFSASHPDHLWSRIILMEEYSALGDEEDSLAEAVEVERAVAPHPNSAFGYSAMAELMNARARPMEALAAVDKAMRLDPRNTGNYFFEQGWAYTQLGRTQEAISALKRLLEQYPDSLWAHVFLVVDYIELGHDDAARAEAAKVLKLNPQFSIETVFPAVGPKGKVLADNQRIVAGLRKAGLK